MNVSFSTYLLLILISLNNINFANDMIESIIEKDIFGLNSNIRSNIDANLKKYSASYKRQTNWKILGVISKKGEKFVLVKVGAKLELKKEGENILDFDIKEITKDAVILTNSTGVKIYIKLYKTPQEKSPKED